MAYRPGDIKGAEHTFVGTLRWVSRVDTLEEMLEPGYLNDPQLAVEVGDALMVFDRDWRATWAVFVGLTETGKHIFRRFEPAPPVLPLPETQPADAGAGRRRAA